MPRPLLFPHIPLFLHLYLVVPPPAMASGSTLTRPSARAQTNQSRVVLFHKDQKQLVSFHVSHFFSCLPVLPNPSTWSHRNLLKPVNGCLTVSYTDHSSFARLHDFIILILCRSHTLGLKHVYNQCRLMWLLHSLFSLRISVRCQKSLTLSCL